MYQTNPAFWQALNTLVQNSEIIIDRPRGCRHPKYPDMTYPVNYGYLKDTASMDGGGIDVWVGSQVDHRLTGIICTIDLMKRDSEIKLLLGCTENEIKQIYQIHNESQSMKGILIPAPED